MLADIEAVLFDLDGTLLDRRRSISDFTRDQWRRFSPELRGVSEAEYVQIVVAQDGDGYTPRRDLFVRVLSQLALPSELADTLLADYRAGFPGACTLFPDAAHTLASLRATGFALGLITNGSARMQRGKLQCLDLASAFDALLISELEGVSKPDPEIFRRALERLGTTAGHAVFVGDHPDVDVGGARRAGMRAIWRRDPVRSQTVEADAIIGELAELLSLVGRNDRPTSRNDAPATRHNRPAIRNATR